MAASIRERELVRTFVELADTLVTGYDIVDLLYRLVSRCARTFDATDAGILIPDAAGNLEVIASTSERSHLIGLLQLDADEGPCVDAYNSGALVTVDNIASTYARWPEFATRAGELGYQSMHAIPLRLRDETIGSLNIFGDRTGPLDADDALAAQALADVATIGILHERAFREATITRQQLQAALDSRVVIEQAKGILAHRENLDMEEAFRRLRDTARTSGRLLSAVAQDVITSATAHH